MKSVNLGAVSFGLIFGLATAVIAANPQQVNQLWQTNLIGADLTGANLENAKLKGATWIDGSIKENQKLKQCPP